MMFRLTTYAHDDNSKHYMLLNELQLKTNVFRSDSEDNPARLSLTNWINGLDLLEEPKMYIGKDFNSRRVTVESV